MDNKANDKILLAMQIVNHIVSNIKNKSYTDILGILAVLWEERSEYEETGDVKVLEIYKTYFKQIEEILANAMEEINKNENL